MCLTSTLRPFGIISAERRSVPDAGAAGARPSPSPLTPSERRRPQRSGALRRAAALVLLAGGLLAGLAPGAARAQTPTLSWAGSFAEAAANDGSVEGSATLTVAAMPEADRQPRSATAPTGRGRSLRCCCPSRHPSLAVFGGMRCTTPYPFMIETLSADGAGPAPSSQNPVHGISQTRPRNSRERRVRPRMDRSR